MAELLQALQNVAGNEEIQVYSESSDTAELDQSGEGRPKRKHPNHHVGPIDESYAEDSRRRCKAFSQRRKTFFFKANQLTSICGASISIKLKSQTGTVYKYKSGEFQQEGDNPGAPMISLLSGPARKGRPNKQTLAYDDSIVPTEGQEAQGTSSTTQNPSKDPCAICHKKDSWLACQKRGCKFWAHARCLGFVSKTPVDMSNVKFFCPKHIQSS